MKFYFDQLEWLATTWGYRRKLILLSFMGASRFSIESDIHKQQYNQHQGKSYERSGINIPQINHNYLSFPNFLSLNAISKDTIPASMSPVKTKKLKGDLKPEKLGIIKIAPNQPAAKLTKNSEEIKNQTGSILVT